jgi:hypothetical protein
MAASDLLAFIHVEKCAGTSLNTWLALSHHVGNLYVRSSNIEFGSLRWCDINPLDLEDTRLRSVSSHHLRTYPPVVLERTLRYITVLRDPTARWISYVRYFGHLRQKDGTLLSLRDYAEWLLDQPPQMTLRQLNGQTNHLAEYEWFRRNGDDVLLIDWTTAPDRFKRYERERLSLASDLIENFGAVGVVEQLDVFCAILQARAPRWDVPLIATDGLNVTHMTDAPPVDTAWINAGDSVGRRLIESFADDYALYRLAQKRQLRDIAELSETSVR